MKTLSKIFTPVNLAILPLFLCLLMTSASYASGGADGGGTNPRRKIISEQQGLEQLSQDENAELERIRLYGSAQEAGEEAFASSEDFSID